MSASKNMWYLLKFSNVPLIRELTKTGVRHWTQKDSTLLSTARIRVFGNVGKVAKLDVISIPA